MRSFIPVVIAGLIISVHPVLAQPEYTIEGHAGGGFGVSWFKNQRSPLSPPENVYGAAALGRIMWHPSRLLSIGLLGGWVEFSRENFSPALKFGSDTVAPGRAVLIGLPLQVVISMQKYGVEIGVGIGAVFMQSTIQDEDLTESIRSELGITALWAYNIEVSRSLSVGPELTLIYMGYRGIIMFIPQFHLKAILLRY